MAEKIRIVCADEEKHPELKHYIRVDGSFCPFCGSDKLEWEGKETADAIVTQKVRCETCKREWVDEYRLVNFYWVENSDG